MPDRAARKRNHQAADWVLRQHEGRMSGSDDAAFRAWLAADPQNGRAHDAARRLMGEAGRAISADPDLRGFKYQPRRTGPVIGALAALAVGLGYFLWSDGVMRLRADIVASADQMPVTTLEDGSVMQMNASSAVDIDMAGDHRTIRLLRGQAWFQVAPDPARPFTVEAGDTLVTALGTAFDVRLDQAGVQVTVTEHAVSLEVQDKPELAARVDQGQRATYDAATDQIDSAATDGQAELAWRRGKLIVDNAPLSVVIDEMNRHFPGTIRIANSALADRRVSGTLNVTDTEGSLSFLREALAIRSTRLGPFVLLRN